ncbi:unnamed protein product, partial [Coregonus sp. 'balchen']
MNTAPRLKTHLSGRVRYQVMSTTPSPLSPLRAHWLSVYESLQQLLPRETSTNQSTSGATSAPGGGSAEAPDLDPGLVLLVHYCLAYPDTQLACWLLIYDGCPSRGDSQAPPPPPAQPRHTRRLIITTFQFLPTGSPSHLEDQELYFMCSTEVCSPADGDCIEGCFS